MYFPTDQTDQLVGQGGEIKIGGAPGAFEKVFQDMEDKLEQVRKIVEGHNVTADDIQVSLTLAKVAFFITVDE